jgi:hypothetical protein
VLPACAPEAPRDLSEEPGSDRTSPLTECTEGIELPPAEVRGPLPVPPPLRAVGHPIGVYDERSPAVYSPSDFVSLDVAAGRVDRHGWLLDAKEGEKLTIERRYAPPFRDDENVDLIVYGPIEGCAAPVVAAVAGYRLGTSDDIEWTAPKSGTYFVGPDYGVFEQDHHTVRVPTHGGPYTVSIRRLGPDGIPVLHHLERIPPSDIVGGPKAGTIGDAVFSDFDGDGDLDIVVWGETIDPIHFDHTSKVWVLERTASGFAQKAVSPTPLTENNSVKQGVSRTEVADFTGDGRLDVLVPGVWYELHEQQPDGSLVARWEKTIRLYNNVALGAVDVDGDGDFDAVETELDIRGGWFHVGDNDGQGHLTALAPIRFDVPDDKNRFAINVAYVDVTGDGRPELVMERLRNDGTSWYGAFSLPDFTQVEPQIALEDIDFGRKSPRHIDVDGDGRIDDLRGFIDLSTVGSVSLAYGLDDGTVGTPWLYHGDGDTNTSYPTVDLGDIDEDGCADVLLAPGGHISVFRGVNCQKSPPPAACAASCGGPSALDDCWCDEACSEFGDCCPDYGESCGE